MAQLAEFNHGVIAEFRANGGKVGGQLANADLLLLTTTGARSGNQRTTPLGHLRDGDRYVLFAAVLGGPKNPDWYHNLVANPEVGVEVGTEQFRARATVLTGADRQRLWDKLSIEIPVVAEYQTRTTRVIPLISLERLAD